MFVPPFYILFFIAWALLCAAVAIDTMTLETCARGARKAVRGARSVLYAVHTACAASGRVRGWSC